MKAAAFFLTMAVALSGQALACSPDTPCQVATGSYLIRMPAGGSPARPAPLLVYLHGFGSSAAETINDTELVQTAQRLGAVLVAPDGREVRPARRGWTYPGTARQGRDDVAFLDEVVADVRNHTAIDPSRMVISGFSAGGSMVWYMACQGKTAFSAYIPIAGAFWEPQPTDCPAGARPLFHIHGVSDQTVPMIGRAIGGPESGIRQGVVMRGMALWQNINQCDAPEVSARPLPGMLCRTWSARQCRSGKSLGICLHDGEHRVEASWLLPVLDWMTANGRSAPPATR